MENEIKVTVKKEEEFRDLYTWRTLYRATFGKESVLFSAESTKDMPNVVRGVLSEYHRRKAELEISSGKSTEVTVKI